MRVLLCQPDARIEETCWIAEQLREAGAEVELLHPSHDGNGFSPIVHHYRDGEWSSIPPFKINSHPIHVTLGWDLVINLEARISSVLWKYLEKVVPRPLTFGVGPSNTTFTQRNEGIQLLRNSSLPLRPVVTFDTVTELFEKLLRMEPQAVKTDVVVYSNTPNTKYQRKGINIPAPCVESSREFNYLKFLEGIMYDPELNSFLSGGGYFHKYPYCTAEDVPWMPPQQEPITVGIMCNSGSQPVNEKTVQDPKSLIRGCLGRPVYVCNDTDGRLGFCHFVGESIEDQEIRHALEIIVCGLQLSGAVFFEIDQQGNTLNLMSMHTLQPSGWWFSVLHNMVSSGQNLLEFFKSAAKGVTFNPNQALLKNTSVSEISNVIGDQHNPHVRIQLELSLRQIISSSFELLWRSEEFNTKPLIVDCMDWSNFQHTFRFCGIVDNPTLYPRILIDKSSEEQTQLEGDENQCQSMEPKDSLTEPLASINTSESELDQPPWLPELPQLSEELLQEPPEQDESILSKSATPREVRLP